MSLLESSLGKIGPRRFTQACLIFAAVVMIVVYPCLNWQQVADLPKGSDNSHVDFPQYYSGAVVVRHGIWDALYPIPKVEIYDQPNHFKAEHPTFLFNAAAVSRNPAYYPEVNILSSSDVAPELRTYFPEVGHYLFFYPPPAALFLWPLSFFSLDFAADILWPTLSYWALFIAAIYASRIHRLFRQTDSYTEGLIILACALFAYHGETHISAGNITPILSALIAFSVYALMRERLFAFSCALIPLVLFKMIGLTWLPLLLLKRAYWRAFLYLAGLSVLLNGIVLALAGPGVYEKFFALAPKMVVPHGIGLVPGIYYKLGLYPHALYLVLEVIFLGGLYYGYWKKCAGSAASKDSASFYAVALLAGTMAVFCLLNFVSFVPYSPNYMFFPFLGWILQEGYRASGFWRYFVLGGTFLATLLLIGNGVVEWGLSHLLGEKIGQAFHFIVLEGGCIVLLPVFVLLVALCSLLAAPKRLGPAR